MKKIAIFQNDFHVGGIQSALINILENIDYSKCEVDLYVNDNEPFYTIPEHENLNVIYVKPFPFFAKLIYFDVVKAFGAKRFGFDKKYDVAIDFNSYQHECAVGALSVEAKKRVMWIHNDVVIKLQNEKKYKVLWHFFKGKFKHFDEFCAVSGGVETSFREMSGLADAKITVIPNYIDTGAIFAKAEQETDFSVNNENYNLCTMGRLCHQKGFDILLNYMAELAEKRPDIHLYMIGDGPDRQALEKQIAELGLGERVSMLGNQKNPFPYLKQMDGFVLTSRYEGQGIVLWEAKSLGLELFMSKHLEKYNAGLTGYDDIVSALCAAERKDREYDALSDYNANISKKLEEVFGIS